MSVFKTYVGDLDDPAFSWNPDDSAYNGGNAPRAVSPQFPALNGMESVGFHLVCKIASGEFSGKQVDWGCWVARVTKAQIVDFINRYYLWAECSRRYAQLDSTFEMEYNELLSYVNLLESGKQYGLVARESADIPVACRNAVTSRRKSEPQREAVRHRRLA